MDQVNIVAPYLTELLKIEQSTGSVMHAIKASSQDFYGFGEAYFSTVYPQKVKGWKLHQKMILNLVVPHGEIRFVIHDGEFAKGQTYIDPLIDVVLGDNNYCRLTVPPNFWVAFQGVGANINILMNIANIEHDPNESLNKSLDFFNVKGWEDFE